MIVFESVSKSFGKVPAVREVTFEIASGESVVLAGPSGSGKTTVLRLIAGLEAPDSGKVFLSGRLASESGWISPLHERGIGMVFQKPALWPHMTLAQNIRFGLSRMKRSEADKRVREMVRFTHLEGLEKRYPHQVSGGEAQRVALARALAPAPPILLLDEPLIGLDQELHKEMIELIHNVRQKTETTTVYVTHDLAEAASIADRVIRLRKGAIEQIGGWDEMQKRESPK